MTKMIQFVNSATKLFETALKKSEEEDYLQALDCINRAIDLLPLKKRNTSIYYAIILEKADIYTQIDLHDYALLEYYQIIDCKEYRDEIYMGIISCFVRKNMLEHAQYFMSYAIKHKIMVESEDFHMFEFLLNSNIEFAEVSTPKQLLNLDDKILLDAKREMRVKNHSRALNLLDTIKVDSHNFVQARCLESVIHIENYDITQAENSLNKVHKSTVDISVVDMIEEASLFYLLTRLQVHFLKGELEQVEDLCNIVDKLNIQEYRDCKRVLFNMIAIGHHRLVFKYASKIADIYPYDVENTFVMAMSAFNLELFDVARHKFVELHTINRNNLVVKEYCKIAMQETGKIQYDNPVPKQPFEDYVQMVKDILAIKKGKKSKALLPHKDIVEWLLYSKEYDLAYNVAIEIVGDKAWVGLVRKYLMSFDGDDYLKILLLHMYLYNNADNYYRKVNKVDNINVNINQYLIRLYPICPSILREIDLVFVDVYWLLCVHLLFYYTTKPFINKLYKKFEKFAQVFADVQDVYSDMGALAACFAYTYGDISIFSTHEKCIKVFGADKRLFDKYIEHWYAHEHTIKQSKDNSRKSKVDNVIVDKLS
jgi:tetratricopeptide (TPR) repeat protein